ncbi:MAG TPA: lantibiotic dehydratase C-terminal domain-containing protein, partial [Pseudonocardiaceae bacterium]|nr:lantibiotic dehydratase C-terminal domain-containing protein [Pseudonocardiaceae bacterium]
MAEHQVWRSLHVHRYGAQDGFLVDGLAPVVAALRAADEVSGMFFLRYWQGGHHIRCRLRLAESGAEQVLGEVTAKLAGYLAEFPSGQDFDVDAFRAAQPTMAALEDQQADEIHPADTIRPADYLPEFTKYGGDLGVAIAEDFFDRSSEIAFRTLREIDGNDSRRLGRAFSTMLHGLCGTGVSTAVMAEFFAHYCVLWSPYVFDEFLATWPRLLDKRRDALVRHAEALLTNAPNLADDPFHTAVRAAWHAVTAAADQVLPAISLGGQHTSSWQRRQILLVSYLHTHNNRLGLIPGQEALLGYFGHHVLSALAGTPPRPDLLETLRRHRTQ